MELSGAQLAEQQRYYQQQNEEAAERLRFSVGFAQSGLQALTLINGGAMVALFTFVGSSNAVKLDFHAMWASFGLFAAGLVFNIIAYLGAHLSQDQFYLSSMESAWRAEQLMMGTEATRDPTKAFRLGTAAQIVGIASAIIALACFIGGAGFALSGVLPR